MNELTKFLVEGILNETTEKAVALFGGGFKPPTKGHLDVVNQGIKQNPEVSEVKILVGGGTRNGFTQDQAVKIWNLYNDVGFIKKPATIIPVSSPFTYYKNYLKDNPDDKVYVFIGSRPGEEKDQFDVKQRSEFVKKYSDNVIPVEVSTGGGVSGTMARKLFKTDLDGFRNMFPENLLDQDFDKILDILNNKSTDSTPKPASNKTEPLTPKEENIDPKSQKKHKGKSAPFGSAYEPLNENATYSSKIDYKQQIKDLTKHMIKKGMNILPLPKVIFKHGDQENASQFLGKTAYYSPSDMTVVLYTEGRHPKDIVRSFAHEMVHHIQNLEDRLGSINTTNTQEDDNLNDIEREAYTKGNMTFRNWTDSLDGEEVTSLNEDLSDVSLDYIKTKLPKLDSYPKSDIILTKEDFVYVSIPQNPNNPFRMVYEIKAFDIKDGTLVAQSSFDYDDNNKLKGTLDVRPDKRRKGIATIIYTLAEKKIGDIIHPEEKHTDSAEKFWQQKNKSFGPKITDSLDGEEVTSLNEKIVGEKIECDNCGWSWNIVDGGDDLYICHKCDHDNEPENGDPFGLKAYARELVNETFKKSVTIDMGPIIKTLEFEMPTGQETDENVISIIDAAPQGKVPHPVFLDFYAKFDKYFGEENDSRMLDNFGLEYLLSSVLNLSNEDIQTVINHYNTTDQDNVEWFEQHDNELERDEEHNIPGFNDIDDDYESVINYRRKQLAKSLEEQERVRIFNPNCGCDKT